MPASHFVAVAFCLGCIVGVWAAEPKYDATKDATNKNPIAKVTFLLKNMEDKLLAEGKKADQDREENIAYCREMKDNIGYAVKTGQTKVETLQASIDQSSSLVQQLTNQLDNLRNHIAKQQSDLQKATDVRKNESDTFKAEEKQSMTSIEVLNRAIVVLQREIQNKSVLAVASNLTKAMSFIVEASAFTGFNSGRLNSMIQQTALLQSRSAQTDAEDEAMAALNAGEADPMIQKPAIKAYEFKSGGIVETLEDLLAKGNIQLKASRQADEFNEANFNMLRNSFEDDIKFSTRDATGIEDRIKTSNNDLSGFNTDMDSTKKTLAQDTKDLQDLLDDCTRKAEDYEQIREDRNSEVEALNTAQKVLNETTSRAITKTYKGAFLLQVSSVRHAQAQAEETEIPSSFEVVRRLRSLAREQNETMLTQLAVRVSSVMRASVLSGADPFAKVKDMLSNMLAKLQKDASDGSSKKAYCDQEIAITQQKLDKNAKELVKLLGRIDSATALSASADADSKSLAEELAKLQTYMADATVLRQNESDYFKETEPELEVGIQGVQKAIEALRAYYDKAGKDAGQVVIGMIEVAESDFAKNLADLRRSETNAQGIYAKEQKEGKLRVVGLQSDIKYKAKEAVDLQKHAAESMNDRDAVQLEQDAVQEYMNKMKEECTVKAEPYEETKRRREADMKGIEDALSILTTQTTGVSLLQSSGGMRGVRDHTQQ